MADNVTLNSPTSAGAVIASDEIAGVQHQLVKVEFGADGAATQVSAANPFPVTDANALTDAQIRATPIPVSGSLGTGDLTVDAWGSQKVSMPFSLDHGLFTFDISALLWFMYEGGAQVYTSTNIVSTDGAAVLTGNAAKPLVRLESRLCPRYQPNRGHLFSTALWMPDKTNNGVRRFGLFTDENGVFFRLKADGKLYACLKSLSSETYEEEIDTTGIAGFDVEKGNVYDIQYQWRGVGNYKFFINL